MMMNKEQEMVIQQAGFKLSGTLSLPAEPAHTAVMLIAGSGKVDREGNHAKFKSNIYKDLSYFFNSIGVAVLRYDKRGTGKSEGVYNETGLYDFIGDAAAWLKALKETGLFKQVIVVGHSEGTIIGPAVLKQEPADGFVFLCGSSGTGAEMLSYQNEWLRKEIRETNGLKGLLFKALKVEKKINKQTQAVYSKIAATSDAELKYRGVKLNAKWMREMNNFDLRDYLSGLSGKLLAVEGGKDVQVKPGSAQDFAEKTGGEYLVIENMNHLLRERTESHSLLGLLKEYKKELKDKPLHPALLDSLLEWIRR
ncbi:alpha/beta hydrolase [Jeotgalibacillus sp. R-1-5s-1]|uniref:alpha/beta hydrolase n=1 Tax=Jeotgalibacillus sp. R-1-5s-1 TaxID=2555897 RepID=UPI00106BB4D6|nr:alpha/beta fold hydrolase [Jeotgalibacillus sp. R-1-5s-1]TFE00085.1 alpha/beta hydrolase [Jeotgalibacillus sp. R-1-5s-1]